MRRRLFNFASVVSLLLCISGAGLWIRSFFCVDVVNIASRKMYRFASGSGGMFIQPLTLFERQGKWRDRGGRSTGVLSSYSQTQEKCDDPRQGLVQAGRRLRWAATPPVDRGNFMRMRAWASDASAFWPRLTPISIRVFASYSNATGNGVERWLLGRGLWLPYSLIVLVTSILPIAWLRSTRARRRRHLRRQQNQCVHCGYDLTGNTSGVCPECGTAIVKVGSDQSDVKEARTT